MSPQEKEAAGYSWMTGPGFGLLFLLVSGALVSARLRLAPLGETAIQALPWPHSMQLSGRGLVRCLRVARTLADLEESEGICRKHVLNALAFRFQNPDPGFG